MNVCLSPEEKQAGAQFKADCAVLLDRLNEADPATYDVPFFIGLFRHLCLAKASRSVAMELREQYLVSPIYELTQVPAGRFGFLYREGRCRACQQSARSGVGRLVDGWSRPPITGRVARS